MTDKIRQKRPSFEAKETYYKAKGPIIRQKRPIFEAKETYWGGLDAGSRLAANIQGWVFAYMCVCVCFVFLGGWVRMSVRAHGFLVSSSSS